MVNASPFKIIFIIIFWLFFSVFGFAQKKQKMTQFSNEFSSYLSEMKIYNKVDQNKEIENIINDFEKKSENFSDDQKAHIINISNIFLKRKLKTKPYYMKFLNSCNIVSLDLNNSDSKFSDWLNVVSKILEGTSNKNLILFFDFTERLYNQSILRTSKAAEWKILYTQYNFSFEEQQPIIICDSYFDLTCFSNNNSYSIEKVKGKYFIFSNRFECAEGIVNWTKYGFSKDSVFAKLGDFSIDTRKNSINIDSVVFVNHYDLKQELYGKLECKLTRGRQSSLFPRFTSFSKDVEFKNIFDNIDYRGGYILQGNEFVADGGKNAEARIVFRRDAKDIFVVNSSKFNITDDGIISKKSGVKIFFEDDSIYHNNLDFKYINSQRKLQLYKKPNGSSVSPMLSSYHNLSIDSEFIEWIVDSNLIKFGSLPGTANSNVEFESIDRFKKSMYESMQGIDATHPLLLIKKYSQIYNKRHFSVKDFASFVKFPLDAVKTFLIHLSNDGFIYYNLNNNRVSILSKLDNYVNAANNSSDYDVISFNSNIQSGQYQTSDNFLVNAALNLDNGDLSMIGIRNVNVSDNRGVYIYPSKGIIIVKKNRNFMFNGQIIAGKGRLNLFGRGFVFNYDDFKLDLNQIDSIRFSIPVKPQIKDEYGNLVLTPLKTVIEAVRGDLKIDHPLNKSGIKSDSFPQYPIFSSFDDSYTFYDKANIYDGVYNRSNFYFHLKPFRIDSLDSYSGEGLSFPGKFVSAGILPDFIDTLKLQDDYSLGFKKIFDLDGTEIYSNRAKFYNEISLSNKGLKGNGDFVYLNSKANSDEVIFFPDSLNLITNNILVTEQSTGVEFPQIKNSVTDAHYEPYNDKFFINHVENDFSFFNNQAIFNGNLLMRPSGITGNGLVTMDNVVVSSSFFNFNANWFGSDTANFKLFDEDKKLAFQANDLKTDIDLKLRTGSFYSNGRDSYVDFPVNKYISYIDKVMWDIDKQSLALGNSDNTLSEFEFVSTHPTQDSLSFFAKSASYSFKDKIIQAFGVNNISIADAEIYPDSGSVIISDNAKFQTLYNSKIVANNLTKLHVFNNSTVNILSAHNYSAKGEYTYTDEKKKTHNLYFNNIFVNSDTVTSASATVMENDSFQINSKFKFNGNVELIAKNKNLFFDGYFMINQNCNPKYSEWFRSASEINPIDPIIDLQDSILNKSKESLFTGSFYSDFNQSNDSLIFYSSFLSKKYNYNDQTVLKASSRSLKYNTEKSSFVVSDKNFLNYYLLNDKTCEFQGAGDIDLNMNFGAIESNFTGVKLHKKNEILLSGIFSLDFYFSSDAMKAMSEDLMTAPGDEFFEYDSEFNDNLSRIFGVDQSDLFITDLEEDDSFENFPEELNHSIVFAKSSFKWNKEHSAFVSKGKNAVFSIFDNTVLSFVDGYIILQKGPNSDILTIYFETEFGDIYCFQYKNGIMSAWSTNYDFTDAISKENESEKIAPKKDGVPAFKYRLSNEIEVEKIRKELRKKY